MLPAVIPAKAGIQETQPGESMTNGFYRRRIAWPAWWSFPQSGNGVFQPLDSGLRRNDDGVDSGLHRVASAARSRPACSRQALLYHLHPCRRAFAGMTARGIPALMPALKTRATLAPPSHHQPVPRRRRIPVRPRSTAPVRGRWRGPEAEPRLPALISEDSPHNYRAD